MRLNTILTFACVALLLCGCKQEESESCQIDDDCDEGLICCKDNPFATETDRGICMTQEECDTMDVSTDPSAEEETDPSTEPAEDPHPDPLPDEVSEDPTPDPASDAAD
jgi:hypothetical protein